MTRIEYETRLYRKGDEDRIIPLLELVFGSWPRFDLTCSKREHWIWKFVDTPTGLNEVFVAETPDGEIIGASTGQIKRVKIGDEVVLARKGAEAAVHPDYRGKGVYSGIWKLKEETNAEYGVSFRWGLTSSPVIIERNSRKGTDAYEPEFPKPLKQLVYLGDVSGFLDHMSRRGKVGFEKSMVVRLGYPALRIYNRVRYGQATAPTGGGLSIKTISCFDERINHFWDRVAGDYDFIVEKSEKYLNWRYCDKRGGGYEVYIAEEEDEIKGFLVLRVNRFDPFHLVGCIVEVLALRERVDVVEALIHKAMRRFIEVGVGNIYFSIIGGHPYEKLMKQYGFVDSRRQPFISYRDYGMFEIRSFMEAQSARLHYQFGEFDSI